MSSRSLTLATFTRKDKQNIWLHTLVLRAGTNPEHISDSFMVVIQKSIRSLLLGLAMETILMSTTGSTCGRIILKYSTSQTRTQLSREVSLKMELSYHPHSKLVVHPSARAQRQGRQLTERKTVVLPHDTILLTWPSPYHRQRDNLV